MRPFVESLEAEAESAAATEATVLHVDDDPNFLELASVYLERHADVTVVTETSARDALDRLREGGVDAVVSDYQMPGMDGLEFLSHVREEHDDLPFVLFTGKGSEEIASDAISAGVTDYLQKETGTEQYRVLANRVENAVERRQATDALAASERRLERLLDSLPGIVYRSGVGDPWPMEFVGGRVADLTGYEAAAFTAGDVTFGDIIVDDDVPDATATVREAVDAGEAFELTYDVETADGERRTLWERGEPLFEDGDPVALQGFIMEQRAFPDADD